MLYSNYQPINNRGIMYIYLLKILPKNLLSYLAGKIFSIPVPSFLRSHLYRLIFVKIFSINDDEFAGRYRDYSSISNFFCRPLKPEVRKIDKNKKSIVSPVDGIISEHGKISNNKLIFRYWNKKRI